MKIDLNAIRADAENFMVHEHFVAGVPVYLVQPIHTGGATWTKDNLIFRSSVWTADGSPVSLSYKKFFNWDEQPAVVPIPANLNDAELIEKIDGSTLLVSMFNDTLVVRTRGTVDATTQDNGWEIDYLKQKYPLAFSNSVVLSGGATVVFEWYSPTNKIVINYGDEPLLYLTAIISHDTYKYTSQKTLDYLANQWGVLRPARYSYASLKEMQASVEAFRGKEGLCVYFNDGQDIRKVKGAQYLYLHRAKSDISSIEKVIDIYLDEWTNNGIFLSYNEFFAHLEKTFDFELATMARGHISKICDVIEDVRRILHGMNNFVTPIILTSMPRKDAAAKILQAYGTTGRSAILFKMLDGKKPGAEAIKKLLFQCLKA